MADFEINLTKIDTSKLKFQGFYVCSKDSLLQFYIGTAKSKKIKLIVVKLNGLEIIIDKSHKSFEKLKGMFGVEKDADDILLDFFVSNLTKEGLTALILSSRKEGIIDGRNQLRRELGNLFKFE